MTTLATVDLEAVTGGAQGWLHPADEEERSTQSWLHPAEEERSTQSWLHPPPAEKQNSWTSCTGGFWHGCPKKPQQ